jgi:hypothetical protein
MNDLLVNNYTYIVVAHVFFMAIGVGGATITDVLFFKFLRKHSITEQEMFVMNTLSQVIWGAIFGIVVTGLGLFVPQAEGLLESSKFLAKMTIVAILVINGVLLNFWISPKMREIFSAQPSDTRSWVVRTRRVAFALGGISIVSWYSAFLLGSLRSLSLSYGQLMSIYLALIFIAVVGSQISERLYMKRVI